MKEVAKNQQLEKLFSSYFQKNWEPKFYNKTGFLIFFHPHWVSVYTRVDNR